MFISEKYLNEIDSKTISALDDLAIVAYNKLNEDKKKKKIQNESVIDDLAHTASTSPNNNLPEPTEEQKKAGNYKKGHIQIHGLDITIENPKGSFRSGVDPNGKPWKIQLKSHYGYIKGTVGKDKDHLDVFLGPEENSEKVFIVHQKNKDGQFDEHKIILNSPNVDSAMNIYLSNYEKGWLEKGLVDSIHELTMDEFKDWLKNGNTKQKYSRK